MYGSSFIEQIVKFLLFIRSQTTCSKSKMTKKDLVGLTVKLLVQINKQASATFVIRTIGTHNRVTL